MLILTDCPESLGAFTSVPTEWSGRFARDLDPADRALWERLGSGPEVWLADWPDPGPPGFWSRTIVVARAPGSQFDALRELLGGGVALSGPVACLALAGRNFHGQRRRAWLAAPGNLHLCIAFEPRGIAARDGMALTLLPAVAAVEGVREASGGTLLPGIKWVNDILLEEKKIGGVLTATQSQGERLTLAVHGIGLNVTWAPEVPPTPFVPSVGCLEEAGAGLTLPGVFAAILASFGKHCRALVEEGPGGLVDAYRASSMVVGREVCVWDESVDVSDPGGAWPPPNLRGVVTAIRSDLALELEGVREPVIKGRLAFAEACRDFGH